MVTAKICLLAQDVVTDSQRNTLSVFHIAEEVVAEGFPATWNTAAIVIWEREGSDSAVIEGEVSMMLEGHRLFTRSMHVDFGQLLRTRSVLKFQGVTVPNPGNLTFRVALRSGTAVEYTVKVVGPNASFDAPVNSTITSHTDTMKAEKTVERCYASVLADCEPPISREHYISEAVFAVMSNGTFTATGFPWQTPAETVSLTANDFAANVLCTKHNSLLSRLDTFAKEFFGAFYQCIRGGIQGLTDVEDSTFEFSGRDLERWLLKVACGATASGNQGGPSRSVPREWVEVLFERKPWPDYFALYWSEPVVYTVPEHDRMRFEFRRNGHGNLMGVTCQFMALEITLALGYYQGIPGERRIPGWTLKGEKKKLNLRIKWP